MALPSAYPHPLEDGVDTASGPEVLANIDVCRTVLLGNVDTDNAHPAAGFKGSQLSAVPGERITQSNLEDNAVISRVLLSSATVDANRAVTSDHIRDGTLVARHFTANSVLSGSIKLGSFAWTPGAGSQAPGDINAKSITTGKTLAEITPLAVSFEHTSGAGVPGDMLPLMCNVFLNTTTSTFWLWLNNVGNTTVSLNNLVIRLYYLEKA